MKTSLLLVAGFVLGIVVGAAAVHVRACRFDRLVDEHARNARLSAEITCLKADLAAIAATQSVR